MAKSKTKEVGFLRTATEVNGVWRFEVDKFHWEFRGVLGINLYVSRNGTDWEPTVHVKDLRDAGMFAEGFVGGVSHVTP